MPNRLTLLASAALLALSTPLAAQDTDAPATTQAPATTETPGAPEGSDAPEAPESAAPAPEASEPDAPETTDAPEQPGEAAAAEQPAAPATPGDAEQAERPGQPYVAETHGDWALRCMRVAEGETEPCQLYQLLEDDDGNAVAEVTVLPLAPDAQAAAGVTVVAPLETLLTEQLSLSIDGGQTARYPFGFCNRAGCVARFGLSDQQLAAFKRGRAGDLRIVPASAPDQDVNLTLSLSGFTAGFEAVAERMQ